MPKAKREATPKPKAADTRPVNQRGQEWQGQKLTGTTTAARRAQKGNLPARWCAALVTSEAEDLTTLITIRSR